MTTDATNKHPRDLDPLDVGIGRATFIKCPDCGQMEVWLRDEVSDHGQCRATPADAACPVCAGTAEAGPQAQYREWRQKRYGRRKR